MSPPLGCPFRVSPFGRVRWWRSWNLAGHLGPGCWSDCPGATRPMMMTAWPPRWIRWSVQAPYSRSTSVGCHRSHRWRASVFWSRSAPSCRPPAATLSSCTQAHQDCHNSRRPAAHTISFGAERPQGRPTLETRAEAKKKLPTWVRCFRCLRSGALGNVLRCDGGAAIACGSCDRRPTRDAPRCRR